MTPTPPRPRRAGRATENTQTWPLLVGITPEQAFGRNTHSNPFVSTPDQ